MSCKSCVYGANTTPQSLVSGNVINFGSVVRRFGCNTNLSGGNGVIDGQGYYNIESNITLEAAAGNVVIALYKDGVAIPGASATITTVADTSYSVVIPTMVRHLCNCESTITAIITGAAASVSNATLIIERV